MRNQIEAIKKFSGSSKQGIRHCQVLGHLITAHKATHTTKTAVTDKLDLLLEVETKAISQNQSISTQSKLR
jgi:hypothetical protein